MGEPVLPAGSNPKVDPETLVLRAKPRRAARFRRGVLIGAAAMTTGTMALLGVVALRPHVRSTAEQPGDVSQPAISGSPDSLSGLPASYGSVPKLGPPLPGDLGKPILEHEQTTLAQIPERTSNAEMTREVDEVRAARQSALLVQSSKDRLAVAFATDTTMAQPREPNGQPASGMQSDANGQAEKVEFIKGLGMGSSTNPHELAASPSPYLLSAGSVIAASLITGLRSDLPGLVSGVVTENVYDSQTGRVLLIPQGSRLVGSYDSQVTFGQQRALLVWQRIIWPDGSSLALDNMPGTDAAGYAGLEDRVDHHDWQLLKGVVLSTLLGVGAELQFSGQGGLTQAVRQSTQQNVSRAGDQLTSKALDVQPTITIRPGAPVRLLVQRDLVLKPWKEEVR